MNRKPKNNLNRETIFIVGAAVLVASVLFTARIVRQSTQLSSQASVTPALDTDFENVVKVDNNHLDLPINNWFEFGDYDGSSTGDGARMWVDNTVAHSGSKSIGLEVSDITKSRRAEFDIFPNSLVGDEFTVSDWIYLPADYGLHAPNIDWNWHEFFVLYSEYVPGSDNYLRLLINQPDITKSIFTLSLGGRKPPSTQFILSTISPFNLPRGKWFNVISYLKRDSVNGAAKVWIDGNLMFDQSGINTKGSESNYHISPAKMYYETTDTTDHKMWVDDLKIYQGYVPPTSIYPSPTASLLPSVTPSPVSSPIGVSSPSPIATPKPSVSPSPIVATVPRVSITSPANNSYIGRSVTISITASSSTAITSVKTYVDGTLLHSSTFSSGTTVTSSFKANTKSWNSGSHVISVTATNASNITGTTQITVNK